LHTHTHVPFWVWVGLVTVHTLLLVYGYGYGYTAVAVYRLVGYTFCSLRTVGRLHVYTHTPHTTFTVTLVTLFAHTFAFTRVVHRLPVTGYTFGCVCIWLRVCYALYLAFTVTFGWLRVARYALRLRLLRCRCGYVPFTFYTLCVVVDFVWLRLIERVVTFVTFTLVVALLHGYVYVRCTAFAVTGCLRDCTRFAVYTVCRAVVAPLGYVYGLGYVTVAPVTRLLRCVHTVAPFTLQHVGYVVPVGCYALLGCWLLVFCCVVTLPFDVVDCYLALFDFAVAFTLRCFALLRCPRYGVYGYVALRFTLPRCRVVVGALR